LGYSGRNRHRPRDYLLVWADSAATNSSPTNLHANFKLSNNGEQVGIFSPSGLLVDGVTFGPQQNNISQGRFPTEISAVYFT